MAFLSREEINRRIIAVANAEIEREAQELEDRILSGGPAIFYRPSFRVYPPKSHEEIFGPRMTGID